MRSKTMRVTQLQDMWIDDHFNIKSIEGENAVDTNLFCGDSPYFPYPTDFIYIDKINR